LPEPSGSTGFAETLVNRQVGRKRPEQEDVMRRGLLVCVLALSVPAVWAVAYVKPTLQAAPSASQTAASANHLTDVELAGFLRGFGLSCF
jgi:hypothetical protein